MFGMKKIQRHFCGNVCRRCINAAFQVKLNSSDCWYEYYPHTCSCFREIQHIVADLNSPVG